MPSQEILDCFALGQREREKRKARIERLERRFRDGADRPVKEREFHIRVADSLYRARYNGRTWDDEPSAQETLDAFCFKLFGCDFDEVMAAYDGWL